jgi:N4-(beta-N-acetylglucosaminyl)-L-asparaginase
LMRNGMSPKDAGMTALKRVVANTVEKRLLNRRRQPNFNVNYYVVNAKGDYAGVALYESQYAVCTEAGARTLPA